MMHNKQHSAFLRERQAVSHLLTKYSQRLRQTQHWKLSKSRINQPTVDARTSKHLHLGPLVATVSCLCC